MGKDTGDDFRDGKVTLPVILAYARGDAEQRRFWKDAIEGRRVSDADLAHAIGLLEACGAVADTLARARHYGQRAVAALGRFPDGRAKSALIEAAEFAVSRRLLRARRTGHALSPSAGAAAAGSRFWPNGCGYATMCRGFRSTL